MSAQPRFDAPAADWLVYADSLQQAGDIRGELIALNDAALRGEKVDERDTYVKEHSEALFGGLGDSLQVTWKHLADNVSLRIGPNDDAVAKLTALLDSPLGDSMRQLSLVGLTPNATDTVELEAAVTLIRERLPKTCTGLALVDDRATRASTIVSADYEPDGNLVTFGSLDPLWGIEHLESLEIHTADPMQLDLGTIKAPALKHFTLHGLRWGESYSDGQSDLAETLTAATWPNLESFDVRLPETFTCSVPDNDGAYVRSARYDEDSFEDYGYDDGYSDGVDWGAELGDLLLSLQDTKLQRLALHSFASSDSVLEALAAAPIESLKVLDLSESDVDDADAAWMLKNPSLFAKLEKLDLTDTAMKDRTAESLAKLGPKIEHSRGGAVHRFLVGME